MAGRGRCCCRVVHGERGRRPRRPRRRYRPPRGRKPRCGPRPGRGPRHSSPAPRATSSACRAPSATTRPRRPSPATSRRPTCVGSGRCSASIWGSRSTRSRSWGSTCTRSVASTHGEAQVRYDLPAAKVGNDNWVEFTRHGGRWKVSNCQHAIGGASSTSTAGNSVVTTTTSRAVSRWRIRTGRCSTSPSVRRSSSCDSRTTTGWSRSPPSRPKASTIPRRCRSTCRGLAPSPRTRRGVLQHLWAWRGSLTSENWKLPFAVYEDGRLVGVQELSATHFRVTRTVESGSWLGQGAQGRGLGTEMHAAVLHLAFDGLGGDRGPRRRSRTTPPRSGSAWPTGTSRTVRRCSIARGRRCGR